MNCQTARRTGRQRDKEEEWGEAHIEREGERERKSEREANWQTARLMRYKSKHLKRPLRGLP